MAELCWNAKHGNSVIAIYSIPINLYTEQLYVRTEI